MSSSLSGDSEATDVARHAIENLGGYGNRLLQVRRILDELPRLELVVEISAGGNRTTTTIAVPTPIGDDELVQRTIELLSQLHGL